LDQLPHGIRRNLNIPSTHTTCDRNDAPLARYGPLSSCRSVSSYPG
jgi:hypothetical protein